MADRDRRGMIIKNTGSEPVRIAMATRIVHLGAGVEKMLTEEEVRDPMLREALQVRTISIVRPATKDEVEALKARLAEGEEE